MLNYPLIHSLFLRYLLGVVIVSAGLMLMRQASVVEPLFFGCFVRLSRWMGEDELDEKLTSPYEASRQRGKLNIMVFGLTIVLFGVAIALGRPIQR